MTELHYGELAKFPKDAYITVADKRVPDHFYIIKEGAVSITHEVHTDSQAQSEVLRPGDFFGVVSAMSGYNQIETAIAISDVTLFPVHYKEFDQLIQNDPSIVRKILLEFSKQMRSFNEALARITIKKKTQGEDLNQLFSVAEYFASQNQHEIAFYAYSQYIKYFPSGDNVSLVKTRLKKIVPFVKKSVQYEKINDLTRVYPKNTMIFSEGEPGDEVFIIKKGSVKISKVVDYNEVLLAVLNPGDIFGEMALLESKPRGANAVAYEECHVMVVSKDSFNTLIKTQPDLVSRLTTLLARRIWLINKQLANTQIADPVGRMLDMLFIQLEKKRIDFKSRESYTFDCGPNELINMVGLPRNEGNMVIQKLMQNKCINIAHDKVAIRDIFEFFKQANYFRKVR